MSSAKKIKVLVCAYSCISESGVKHSGGEAGLWWNMVKNLSRFFDVYVLTHSYNKQAIGEAIQKEGIKGVHFFYFKLPAFLSFLEYLHSGGIQIYSYLWQIKAYFIAKKLHKEIVFDIFHHVTYANDWMASYIGALLPIPYIRGPGGGAHKVPKAFVSSYPLKNRFLEYLRAFGQWIFRHDPFFLLGQSKARALLVCNREAKEAIPKKWQSKVYFFPVNGISEEDLSIPSPKDHSDKLFSVITAGKFLKIKSFDLAIKAFKIFHNTAQNSEFILFGDGPELENLRNLVNALELKDIVHFKTWAPRDTVLSEIATSDVFLFPSLRDGGGQVVVEAMACGKPVVCFDISGPGFHIHEEWGIKIKPDNPEQSVKDMAKALEMLYYNKDLREKLGQKAKERAKNFYQWDKLGENLEKIYTQVVLKYEGGN